MDGDASGIDNRGADKPSKEWSSHERATFLLEIVGVVGIIGALGFSGCQIQKSNAAMELTNEQLLEAKYESVYGHQLDLWQQAIQEPEVAPYIVGQWEPTGLGPERAQVDAALANALDFYAYVFQQLAPRDEDGDLPLHVLMVHHRRPVPPGIDPGSWAGWSSWASTILIGFDNAPGMCENLLEKAGSGGFVYDSEFIAAVQDAGRC